MEMILFSQDRVVAMPATSLVVVRLHYVRICMRLLLTFCLMVRRYHHSLSDYIMRSFFYDTLVGRTQEVRLIIQKWDNVACSYTV